MREMAWSAPRPTSNKRVGQSRFHVSMYKQQYLSLHRPCKHQGLTTAFVLIADLSGSSAWSGHMRTAAPAAPYSIPHHALGQHACMLACVSSIERRSRHCHPRHGKGDLGLVYPSLLVSHLHLLLDGILSYCLLEPLRLHVRCLHHLGVELLALPRSLVRVPRVPSQRLSGEWRQRHKKKPVQTTPDRAPAVSTCTPKEKTGREITSARGRLKGPGRSSTALTSRWKLYHAEPRNHPKTKT